MNSHVGSRTRHIWRWSTATVITAVVLLGSARPVSAHADLLTTNPAADSVLDTSPAEIVLTFTEPVDPTEDAIRLVTARYGDFDQVVFTAVVAITDP